MLEVRALLSASHATLIDPEILATAAVSTTNGGCEAGFPPDDSSSAAPAHPLDSLFEQLEWGAEIGLRDDRIGRHDPSADPWLAAPPTADPNVNPSDGTGIRMYVDGNGGGDTMAGLDHGKIREPERRPEATPPPPDRLGVGRKEQDSPSGPPEQPQPPPEKGGKIPPTLTGGQEGSWYPPSRERILDGIPIIDPNELPKATNDTTIGVMAPDWKSRVLNGPTCIGPAGATPCVGVILIPNNPWDPTIALHFQGGSSVGSGLRNCGFPQTPYDRSWRPLGPGAIPPPTKPNCTAVICGGGDSPEGRRLLERVIEELRRLGIPIDGYVNDDTVYVGADGKLRRKDNDFPYKPD